MSNGYVVESFADAPMRVRAWFESEDDAREYAGKLGASAYMHAGEASYEVAADVAGRVEELQDRLHTLRSKKRAA